MVLEFVRQHCCVKTTLLGMAGNLNYLFMAWLMNLNREHDTLAHESSTSARCPSATGTAAVEKGLTALLVADSPCHMNCIFPYQVVIILLNTVYYLKRRKLDFPAY